MLNPRGGDSRLLFIGALVCGSAVAARADTLLVNGGFESGQLDPWSAEGSFDTTGAQIVSPGRLDQFALHLDAGEYDDQYVITQNVTPTPVAEIVSASLWSMTHTPRWGTSPFMIFHYDDGSTSQQAFGLTSDWTYTDATGALTPGEVLTSLEIHWFGLGDEGPSSELFLDDIAIETVPGPGIVGFTAVAAGMLGLRRRR
jgi:hypothetical protein